MTKVKVISDGTAENTRVLVNGQALPGVTAIEFGRIVPNEFVTVRIELENVELEIEAECHEQVEPGRPVD